MTKITTQLLLDAGYKPFKDTLHNLGEWYRSSYQKRFRDERGTRYFINFTHGVYSGAGMGTRAGMHFFSADVQFCRDGLTFNVKTLNNDDTTIEQIEELFETMFVSMGVSHYDD